jgi:hypothetical protein
MTTLVEACATKDLDMVKLLMNEDDCVKVTEAAVKVAASDGCVGMTEWLLFSAPNATKMAKAAFWAAVRHDQLRLAEWIVHRYRVVGDFAARAFHNLVTSAILYGGAAGLTKTVRYALGARVEFVPAACIDLFADECEFLRKLAGINYKNYEEVMDLAGPQTASWEARSRGLRVLCAEGHKGIVTQMLLRFCQGIVPRTFRHELMMAVVGTCRCGELLEWMLGWATLQPDQLTLLFLEACKAPKGHVGTMVLAAALVDELGMDDYDDAIQVGFEAAAMSNNFLGMVGLYDDVLNISLDASNYRAFRGAGANDCKQVVMWFVRQSPGTFRAEMEAGGTVKAIVVGDDTFRVVDEPRLTVGIAQTCSICQEAQTGVATACGHEFCGECLQRWGRSTFAPTCPTCRAPIHECRRIQVVVAPEQKEEKRTRKRKL